MLPCRPGPCTRPRDPPGPPGPSHVTMGLRPLVRPVRLPFFVSTLLFCSAPPPPSSAPRCPSNAALPPSVSETTQSQKNCMGIQSPYIGRVIGGLRGWNGGGGVRRQRSCPKKGGRKIMKKEGRNGRRKMENAYLVIILDDFDSNCILMRLKFKKILEEAPGRPLHPLPFEVSGSANGESADMSPILRLGHGALRITQKCSQPMNSNHQSSNQGD